MPNLNELIFILINTYNNYSLQFTGFIVLLIIVVIILVFLGRTGRLQPAKQRVTSGIRTIRNTIRIRSTYDGYNVRYISSIDKYKSLYINIWGLGLWCLKLLSTIVQLYRIVKLGLGNHNSFLFIHDLSLVCNQNNTTVPDVEQELFDLKFSVYCFVDHCSYFSPFYFSHCIFIDLCIPIIPLVSSNCFKLSQRGTKRIHSSR